MKLYLAGPLFTTSERTFNSQLKALLQAAGHDVWLPQDHEPRDLLAAAIFQKDVEGIEWADVVVANMDGSDPDSGTCWECGYAYGKKSIVLYRTDFRSSEDPAMGPYNLMLTQSATARIEAPFSSIDVLAKKLAAVLAKITPNAASIARELARH